MNIAHQAFSYLRGYLVPDGKSNQRDALLDFAKGGAIVLVVLGHTLQGQTEQFDELYGFRFIYSFHMPLFAFLAGAAAAHWVTKFNTSGSLIEITQASIYRVRQSAVHLLLPFFSWTVIAFWMGSSQESLADYLWKVFKQADYSLWFLPCIFWCTTFTSLFMLCISAARKIIAKTSLRSFSIYMEKLPIQITILLLVWVLVRRKLPFEFGLNFTNFFFGGLFVFFLFGMMFFKKFVEIKSVIIRIVPYVIFLVLLPYWHRTMPDNLIQDVPDFLKIARVAKIYTLVVALSGTLAVIDLLRVVQSLNIKILNVWMCYLGTASLGIYAMHFYFLGYKPPVVAALLICLLLYQLISLMPFARTILLGK